MNPEEIMNIDDSRIKRDLSGTDLVATSDFSPMQDDVYPFVRDKLSCIVCNPGDKVSSMKMERSLFEFYRVLTADKHYNSPGYMISMNRHREISDALDLNCINFANAITIVYQGSTYPDSVTDRVIEAPVSLICVNKDGKKYMFYGTVIVFGIGFVSLPQDLQWYMLSNSMLLYNKKFGYTAATMVYEDTIDSIVRNALSKESMDDDWKVYAQKKVWKE